MKKWIKGTACLAMVGALVMAFSSCTPEYTEDNGDEWKEKFKVSAPDLENAGTSEETANKEGWYVTLSEDFDGDTMPEMFSASPHGLRKTEYWCDQMVKFKDGMAVIGAESRSDHECDICPKEGEFTSGIETRVMKNDESVSIFEQAFGYFEARVQLPKSGGMWSAFWLQSESMRKIGHEGEDGTEIDIYESSFYNGKRSEMGHALHFDGYDKKDHRCHGTTRDCGIDLYDGFHTFAVKWTPEEYVFYIDGKATWATDEGGVSKVPAFLRLTNEVRPNKVGPYSQKLGDFEGDDFLVDYVRVYQNSNYLSSIRTPDSFEY